MKVSQDRFMEMVGVMSAGIMQGARSNPNRREGAIMDREKIIRDVIEATKNALLDSEIEIESDDDPASENSE